MQSYRFRVTGKVQGVWFRAHTEEKALAMGVSGYVRNLPDGSVEAAATLDGAGLEAFAAMLREGSPLSEVAGVEVEEIDGTFTGPFRILR